MRIEQHYACSRSPSAVICGSRDALDVCAAALYVPSATRKNRRRSSSRLVRNIQGPGMRRLLCDTSGASLVEAALAFPILLLLTFGSLDVALFLFHSNAAAKAAHAG